MVECLNMGLHEPESVDSAHRWSSRFFDCCIIMLIQTAYKIYKCCRDRKLGNEKSMTHAEFNEDVVDHLLHNKGWRSEKLAIAENRRVSVRVSDVDASLA